MLIPSWIRVDAHWMAKEAILSPWVLVQVSPWKHSPVRGLLCVGLAGWGGGVQVRTSCPSWAMSALSLSALVWFCLVVGACACSPVVCVCGCLCGGLVWCTFCPSWAHFALHSCVHGFSGLATCDQLCVPYGSCAYVSLVDPGRVDAEALFGFLSCGAACWSLAPG